MGRWIRTEGTNTSKNMEGRSKRERYQKFRGGGVGDVGQSLRGGDPVVANCEVAGRSIGMGERPGNRTRKEKDAGIGAGNKRERSQVSTGGQQRRVRLNAPTIPLAGSVVFVGTLTHLQKLLL